MLLSTKLSIQYRFRLAHGIAAAKPKFFDGIKWKMKCKYRTSISCCTINKIEVKCTYLNDGRILNLDIYQFWTLHADLRSPLLCSGHHYSQHVKISIFIFSMNFTRFLIRRTYRLCTHTAQTYTCRTKRGAKWIWKKVECKKANANLCGTIAYPQNSFKQIVNKYFYRKI